MARFEQFYRGDQFTGTVYYAPPKGGLPNLLGYTVTSKVLDFSGNRHEGTCVLANDGLSVTVTFPFSITKDWAIGLARWNIRFELGESAFSTAMTEFEVQNPPTTI